MLACNVLVILSKNGVLLARLRKVWYLLMGDATRRPLVIIFVVALILVPSFVAAVRSKMIHKAVEISNVVICEDLNHDLTPIGRISDSFNFPYGITQVCIAFSYRGSGYFETHVEWFHEGKLIHSEEVNLDRKGTRIFYLLRDDGAPLKKGLYEFSIVCMGERLSNISFSIGGMIGETLP